MCCCGDIDESSTKPKHTEASLALALLYLCFGIFVYTPYIVLSIIWYIECNKFESDDDDGAQFLCGSWAMWLCVGWVPVFVYILVTIGTTRYIINQSKSAMKVLNSQRAWLITFVVLLMTVLFVIHTAYICYLIIELYNNEGCASRGSDSNTDDILYFHNCDTLDIIIMLLFVWCFIIIIYVCVSLSTLFGIVNGRIATPVEYETARRLETERITPGEVAKSAKLGKLATRSYDGDMDDENESDSNRSEMTDSEGNTRVVDMQLPRTEAQKAVTKLRLNDRVFCRLSARTNEGCFGTIEYWGPVPGFSTEYTTMMANYYYGIRLDEPRGNVDGSFRGKRYFHCTPGFGVFLPPPDVRLAKAKEDPMQNGQASGVALTIARNDNPRHLLNGHLFGFLRDNIRFSGIMTYVTIGTIDFVNHMARTDALLESIIPMSGHNRRHYNVMDKRRTSMAPSHNNLHQLLPTLARNTKYQYFYDKHMMADYDEKTDSDDSETLHDSDDEAHRDPNMQGGLPKVHLWYLQLHGTWEQFSNAIVSHGQFDYQSARWVTYCQKTAQRWYTLLGLDWKSQFSTQFTKGGDEIQTTIDFGSCPIPLFARKKGKHKNKKNKKHSRYSDSQPHYLALGIFQSHYDKAQQELSQVGTLETKPQQLQRGKKVEFTLKRLIHESVPSIEDLIPYYKAKLYSRDENKDKNKHNNNRNEDSSDDEDDDDDDDDDYENDRKSQQQRKRKYAWFPIDWVYAEVDFEDGLNEEFKELYDSYDYVQANSNSNTNTTVLYDEDYGKQTYNPYWMMKYPRVPLFAIRMRLPLDSIARFANEIEEKSGEELYNTRKTRMSYAYAPDSNNASPNHRRNQHSRHLQPNMHNSTKHTNMNTSEPMFYDNSTNQSSPYHNHTVNNNVNSNNHQNSGTATPQQWAQGGMTGNTHTTGMSSVGPYAEYGFGNARMQHFENMEHDANAHGQYGTNYSSREPSQDYFANNNGHVPKQSAANIRYRNNGDDENIDGNNNNNSQVQMTHQHLARYPSQGDYANNNENVALDEETNEQLSQMYQNGYDNKNNNNNRNNNNSAHHSRNASRKHRNNRSRNDGVDVVYADDNRHGGHGHDSHHHHGNSGSSNDGHPEIVYSD